MTGGVPRLSVWALGPAVAFLVFYLVIGSRLDKMYRLEKQDEINLERIKSEAEFKES